MFHTHPLARTLGRATAGLGLALACSAGMAAVVELGFQTSYTVTTDEESPPITSIVIFESNGEFGPDQANTLTLSFSAAGYGATTEIVNPFPDLVPMERSLLLGLVQDLPNDPPGQEHLVLFMNDAAASNVQGIAWGTIFTTTLEGSIIGAMHDLTDSSGDNDQEAVGELFSFANEAATEAKVGPNGLPGSIWFDTEGSFSAVAFSSGQTLATGVGAVVAVVPEPGTAALWLAGLGVVALRGRRTLGRRA